MPRHMQRHILGRCRVRVHEHAHALAEVDHLLFCCHTLGKRLHCRRVKTVANCCTCIMCIASSCSLVHS